MASSTLRLSRAAVAIVASVLSLTLAGDCRHSEHRETAPSRLAFLDGEFHRHWQRYVEADAKTAEQEMRQVAELCRREIWQRGVPDAALFIDLCAAYGRLYCTELAQGKTVEAALTYELARCAWLEYQYSFQDTEGRSAKEVLDALTELSQSTLQWYVLGLDIQGLDGMLPRYVRNHCDVFRDVLEAHGVSCPGEGSEQSPGKAGGNEAGTRRKKAE